MYYLPVVLMLKSHNYEIWILCMHRFEIITKRVMWRFVPTQLVHLRQEKTICYGELTNLNLYINLYLRFRNKNFNIFFKLFVCLEYAFRRQIWCASKKLDYLGSIRYTEVITMYRNLTLNFAHEHSNCFKQKQELIS